MVAKTAAFEKAVTDSRNLKAKPTNDELLELYAFFKQGSQDPPFNPDDKPSAFNFQAKYKFNAWKKVVDEGLSPKEAQAKYVSLVEKLKGVYGFEG